jgi:hypothetical protein
MSPRLYVLVRKDLPESYRAVQAGHAVAEWLLHDQSWQNETLIYLTVTNEFSLYRWADKLDRKEIKWIGFREPDIGNQLTAIATLSDGRVFRNLELL